MQTLKEIKKRVGSVKNTQKITNAMKLVSSAKFNKAGKAVVGARPYRQALDDLIRQLLQPDVEHVFLQPKQTNEQQKTLVLLFASDRGLCGALNANMLKYTERTLRSNYGDNYADCVDFIAIGRKAQQFCRKHKLNCILEQSRIEQLDQLMWQRELIKTTTASYQSGRYDQVYLAFQLFVSGLKQVPSWQQFLPITPETPDAQETEMLLEPDFQQVIDQILHQHLGNQLFCALLNSLASEHCARMNAMDSATNNAKKVVKDLTLQYNRGRQAAITKELIEITAGVQAI